MTVFLVKMTDMEGARLCLVPNVCSLSRWRITTAYILIKVSFLNEGGIYDQRNFHRNTDDVEIVVLTILTSLAIQKLNLLMVGETDLQTSGSVTLG